MYLSFYLKTFFPSSEVKNGNELMQTHRVKGAPWYINSIFPERKIIPRKFNSLSWSRKAKRFQRFKSTRVLFTEKCHRNQLKGLVGT
jgi:hypothetical protein